ncbi:uncharacterized protein LOC110979669 [Acanthaster planci]|uniref:Uncharacterized protein LOC110979669 n=1 Tax=Acanthaster planci TaxID=133434 RepID=A0A8B7YIB3_ACAPL|nr:uncharacterized protein LOC110979669 [Acanthaster planci]
MPVKLLATNPFAEPARLEYEPSPSPAMRAYRWKRPLGVLPQYLRPTATGHDVPRLSGHAGRPHTQGRPSDARQLFSLTQAATEHLRAATQMGYREETKSCDPDLYRIGGPPFGANNNNNGGNSNNTGSPKSKTQLPNIKQEEGSRPGFEHRLGKQTYSRTEVLLKLQKGRKPHGKQGPTASTGEGAGVQGQDFPVINARETKPCTCGATYLAKEAKYNGSESGYHSKESSGAKSQNSSLKCRRISSTPVTVAKVNRDGHRTNASSPDSSGQGNTGQPKLMTIKSQSGQPNDEPAKRKIGFVEVATPLYRELCAGSPESDVRERSAGTSSPVVSNDADSVCEELQKIVLRRAKHDPTCATPFGIRWREDMDDSPLSDASEKNRFDRAMQALQPPVPHVIWPENKYFSPHTVFVYASPSRLAPMVIPSHSVDCPQCKFYQASSKGDVCPPNSPTPWMHKEYGFYPVERHFGSKAEQ